MNRWALCAGTALFTACGFAAVTIAAEAPSATQMSAQVDALFAQWAKPTSPGCAVAVMKDGQIVHERGYGMADLDHDIPITPDTVFHVASISKQFTAASILLLASDGKLKVDDPARQYVPELPDFGVPVTLRQLANHTSGLRDQWNLLQLAGWRYSLDLITDEDVMRVLARQKGLNFKPGAEYLYSNAGFTVLAQAVKHVSGKSIREFTTEHIFTPLGMTQTHFRDDHAEIVKKMAYGYVPKGDTFALSNTQFDTAGATSLLTTVRDLAKWDENFYQPKVGDQALLARMTESGVLNTGEKTGYGFGLWSGTYRGQPIVYHGGSDAGYRADIIRFPKQHFSVAATCNLSTSAPGTLTRAIADIYLAKDLKPKPDDKPITLTEAELGARAGLYLDTRDEIAGLVKLADKKLTVAFSPAAGAKTYALIPLDTRRFRIEGQTEILAFGDKGATRIYDDPLAVPQSFMRVATENDYGLGGKALADFAGTYHSTEIDATYTVTVAGDRLVISNLKRKPTPLIPVLADLFDSDFAKVRFTRTAEGKVDGLQFNTGRVRALPLAKIR